MSKSETGRTPEVAGWARRHPDLILALPEPSETWTRREAVAEYGVPEDLIYRRRRLDQGTRVIRSVEMVPSREDGSLVHEYRTDRTLYEYAQRVASQRGAELPCGHRSGFVTVDADRGVYECGFEYCSERYDRDVIEAVFQ